MDRLHKSKGHRISCCCALLGYSKQAYYKQLHSHQRTALQESILLDEVVTIRKNIPAVGGRKLYHMLQERLSRKLLPGRDALFTLLGRHGLLLRRRKGRVPKTTHSWHHYHTYPDIYKGCMVDAPNRVWVADITYIRLVGGKDCFLSLLTDVYSHKIVGWYLAETLSMDGPLKALRQALKSLPEDHTLIHHSDRGVQYCSHSYTNCLKAERISISMTENSDPRENAIAERVNGILKSEWLDREELTTMEQARGRIAQIVGLYNDVRPHLSIDYLNPSQAHQREGQLKRKWKTYYKKKESMEKKEEIGIFAQDTCG